MAHVKSTFLGSFTKENLKGNKMSMLGSRSSQSSNKTKTYGAALGKVGDALNKSYEKKSQSGGSSKVSFGRQLSASADADKRKNKSGSSMMSRQVSVTTQQKSKDKKTTGTRV